MLVAASDSIGLVVELAVAVAIAALLDRFTRPSALDRYWRRWLQDDHGARRCRILSAVGMASGLAGAGLGHLLGLNVPGDQAWSTGAAFGSAGFAFCAASSKASGSMQLGTMAPVFEVLSLGRGWVIADLDSRSSLKVKARVEGMTLEELGPVIARMRVTAGQTWTAEEADRHRWLMEAAMKNVRSLDPYDRQEGLGELQAISADLVIRLRVPPESL